MAFDRVALDHGHIEYYGLTSYPPKPTDLRSRRWTGRTCQLEALPPDTLASLLASGIEVNLDSGLLARAREAEAQERRQIARALTSGR